MAKKKNIYIKLKNHQAECSKLARELKQFSQDNNLPYETLHHLNLAIEELFINAISYGYKDCKGHDILVRIALKGQVIEVEMEDDGAPFNPLNRPEPAVDCPVATSKIGGLGIYLVKNIMDSVDYKRKGEKNIVSMTLKISHS